MWIESEPADWLMMRYFVCFEPGDPNPEDRHARAYLRAHGLEPKRTWSGERSGAACEVLQFGQCYLGRHLAALDALRTRGIVAEAVGAWLRETAELPAGARRLGEARMRDLAWMLAGVVIEHDAARSAEGDPLRILLDVDVLRGALPDALRAATADRPADVIFAEEA